MIVTNSPLIQVCLFFFKKSEISKLEILCQTPNRVLERELCCVCVSVPGARSDRPLDSPRPTLHYDANQLSAVGVNMTCIRPLCGSSLGLTIT